MRDFVFIFRGFSGRYCEVSLNEQCGAFPSMTIIEIDCVLCICYNGLFMCDIQPFGLCRNRQSNRFLTRSMRIKHALHLIQYRFRNIHSFTPMTRHNVTLEDDTQSVDLKGYRIVLNHSLRKSSSVVLLFICLLSIYLFINLP